MPKTHLLAGFAATGAAAALALAIAVPARAQVTTDPRALDALKPGTEAPAQPSQPARPAAPRPQPPARSAAPAQQPTPTPAPPPPAPPQVRVPLAPPPPPSLPPALAVPARPPAVPSPAPVVADAPGAATPLDQGVRLTFGEGRSDFNPGTDSALRTLAREAPPASTFTVTAFAPGTPEDPSTPRRLALSRGLAVRAVLIAEGVASPRIYVKALGATAAIAEGPPDRVDVTVAAPSPAPPPQARSSQ
jgi:outer membrane protein OmpA-like peptidoglycan-associated protein